MKMGTKKFRGLPKSRHHTQTIRLPDFTPGKFVATSAFRRIPLNPTKSAYKNKNDQTNPFVIFKITREYWRFLSHMHPASEKRTHFDLPIYAPSPVAQSSSPASSGGVPPPVPKPQIATKEGNAPTINCQPSTLRCSPSPPHHQLSQQVPAYSSRCARGMSSFPSQLLTLNHQLKP